MLQLEVWGGRERLGMSNGFGGHAGALKPTVVIGAQWSCALSAGLVQPVNYISTELLLQE